MSNEEQEDPDIAIIKARKMKALREQAAGLEKARIERRRFEESNMQRKRNNREVISDYLYDRGEEVLKLAESQFPIQTKSLINEIIELIRIGDIRQKISGGELLALFRSVGLNVRISTTIKIEDHGKLVSLADKLKQGNEGVPDGQ
ncbi:MAG TPA: DNA-binding protein [Nitrososphaeraceae archaeon]|jgi:DNA-binding TFAR19-related protein (PDSD5 family)|nr:DNA-binding protein [Nitrososphaeraceae archaeon]